jgi:hypothetical protein
VFARSNAAKPTPSQTSQPSLYTTFSRRREKGFRAAAPLSISPRGVCVLGAPPHRPESAISAHLQRVDECLTALSHPDDLARFRFALSEEPYVNIHLSLAPLIALLAGILILVQPKLLNYIVAIYLIIIGILGLVGRSGMQLN